MGSNFLSPVRLAILETDTAIPGLKAKYGTYGGIFRDLFERALSPRQLEPELHITHHDVVNGDFAAAYPDPDQIDAILITGSKYDSFASDDWITYLINFTRLCLETNRDVRVIGVCFGHQIIGRALGAQVGRNHNGWELGVVSLELTDIGKLVFGNTSLRIHQVHQDIVMSHPAGVIGLAQTDVCPVQAMYIPKRMLSLQGHPEFTEDMVREILDVNRAAGVFNDELFEQGRRRVADKHDGVDIGRVLLRFLRE